MSKRRRWLLLSSAAALAGVLAALAPPEEAALDLSASAGSSRAARTATSGPYEPTLVAALAPRQALDRPRGNPFYSPAPAAPPRQAAPVPAPPAPPANPYRFAGTFAQEGHLKIFLAAGDRVYEALPGEELEGGYRVRAASPDGVTLIYTPLDLEQQVAPGLAPSTN